MDTVANLYLLQIFIVLVENELSELHDTLSGTHKLILKIPLAKREIIIIYYNCFIIARLLK